MEQLIYVCGFFNSAFAVFHILFWKIFRWKKDLKQLSFANKAIMQILNIQLTYFFLFVAMVCFIFPNELLTTNLGRFFLLGNSVFWFIRTLQQFIFLSVNHFKIHLLTFLFILGTILFAIPFFIK